MNTGLIFTKSSLDHDTGDSHPENKFRIQSILDKLKTKKNLNLEWSEPDNIDISSLNKTHDNNYIQKVKKGFSKQRTCFLRW